MAEPVQDAALQNSLLPHAHAQVLREMMQWVKNDPPAGMVEAKGQMLEELAEIDAEKAEAEVAAKVRVGVGCKMLQTADWGLSWPSRGQCACTAASVTSYSLLEPPEGRGWVAAKWVCLGCIHQCLQYIDLS